MLLEALFYNFNRNNNTFLNFYTNLDEYELKEKYDNIFEESKENLKIKLKVNSKENTEDSFEMLNIDSEKSGSDNDDYKVNNLSKYENKNDRIRLWIKTNYNVKYSDLLMQSTFTFTKFGIMQDMFQKIHYSKYIGILESVQNYNTLIKSKELYLLISELLTIGDEMTGAICDKIISEINSEFILLPGFDTFHPDGFEERYSTSKINIKNAISLLKLWLLSIGYPIYSIQIKIKDKF